MPKTKGELPDVDPEELNEMIRDMAQALNCPFDVHPDHVDLNADPEREAGGFNRGCMREGKPWDCPTIYREGQKWRRKAIAELQKRPEWVTEWRAGREMDRRVRELCEAKDLRFAAHECPPWMVRCDEELPDPQDGMWGQSARLAQRLRRQLEEEIRAGSTGSISD